MVSSPSLHEEQWPKNTTPQIYVFLIGRGVVNLWQGRVICLIFKIILMKKLETKVCEQTLKLACESLTFYLVLKASSLKYEAYIKKIDR